MAARATETEPTTRTAYPAIAATARPTGQQGDQNRNIKSTNVKQKLMWFTKFMDSSPLMGEAKVFEWQSGEV